MWILSKPGNVCMWLHSWRRTWWIQLNQRGVFWGTVIAPYSTVIVKLSDIISSFWNNYLFAYRNLNLPSLRGLIQTLTCPKLVLQIKPQCSREKLKKLVSCITIFITSFANKIMILTLFLYSSGKLVERTMMRKYGVENVNNHFISFNTICDATQVTSCSLFPSFCQSGFSLYHINIWWCNGTSCSLLAVWFCSIGYAHISF